MLSKFFRWVRLLFSRPTRREIFSYFDGSRRRWIDPLVVQRDLDKQGGKNWAELLSVVGIPGGPMFEKMPPEAQMVAIAEANAAVDELAKLVRSVYGCEPFGDCDGRLSGLTDSECLSLLASYLGFLADLEADARPTSSLPSASPESSSTSCRIESSSDSMPLNI